LTTQKTDNKTKLSEKKTLILLKLNPLQHQMPQNSIYIYTHTKHKRFKLSFLSTNFSTKPLKNRENRKHTKKKQ
jgi:hypothetical protein